MQVAETHLVAIAVPIADSIPLLLLILHFEAIPRNMQVHTFEYAVKKGSTHFCCVRCILQVAAQTHKR